MKFAVRFSLTLVVLLAMVNAEPKTYMVETGDGDGEDDDGGKESLRLEIPMDNGWLRPRCMDHLDCWGDQTCIHGICQCNMPDEPAYANCFYDRCNLCQCAPCKSSERCSVRVSNEKVDRVCRPKSLVPNLE